MDNLEYVPELSQSDIGPLTADLDFNFNKGVNVAAGSVAGDTVEYQQFTNAITDLASDISEVQVISTGLHLPVSGRPRQFCRARAQTGSLTPGLRLWSSYP